MTTFDFPSVLVPLLGLVFLVMALTSLSFHVQKNKTV